MKCRVDYYNSPIGIIRLVEENNKLVEAAFVNQKEDEVEASEVLDLAKLQLKEYFNGERQQFDLPIYHKGTEFQEKVWNELCKIPYGECRTYKEIAEAIGNPKAVRAVGNANNKNRLGIIIPCHRVIASDHTLAGYAGGIVRKQALIEHEREVIGYW